MTIAGWSRPDEGPLTWDVVVRRTLGYLILTVVAVTTLVSVSRHWSLPRGPFAVALVVLAAGGMAAATVVSRRRGRYLPVVLVPVTVLSALLPVAAPAADTATVLLFFPVGMAAVRWSVRASIGLAGAVAVLYWGGTRLVDHHWAQLWLLAALAGVLLGGLLDRAYHDRVRQTRELLAQTDRARSAEARSAALAERTRIAREMHDVLAHSLAGLAIQLEAADALLSDGRTEQAAQVVRRSRQLAREGLAETRQAVLALREGGSQPLPDALEELLRGHGLNGSCRFRVTGTRRELDPEAGFALYRVAQESLTNATRHAPGAAVDVTLSFTPTRVTLTVRNGPPAGPVGAGVPPGPGGYGLTGMRERVEPLGGELTAGPDGAGWLVAARIPL